MVIKPFQVEPRLYLWHFFRWVLRHLEVSSQFWSNGGLWLNCPTSIGSRDILCKLQVDPTTWLAFWSLHKPSNDVLDSWFSQESQTNHYSFLPNAPSVLKEAMQRNYHYATKQLWGLDESMNRRHSDGSYSMSKHFISPWTSLQKTRFPSLEKKKEWIPSLGACTFFRKA